MYGEDAHLEAAYEDRFTNPMHGDPMDEDIDFFVLEGEDE